ncbi:dynein axonemal heavy chain 10-like [Saccostrea echinata]|uniref:dynein axonemal heavy chain 10-like n=1 Tax=Saccostrea echinata TaxID=191078 RepID=UPI002A8036AB|nr:dynein axonemal heavy chain 10-like [Saccostrea echinata]
MTTVSKGDIIELKALHNPPVLVKYVLEATVLLLGHSPAEAKNWKFVRGILNDPTLLNQLKNFHAENCDPESAKKAKELLEDITEEKVCKVSKAASQLVNWAKNAVDECESAGKLKDPS